jgi:hypothetical protein
MSSLASSWQFTECWPAASGPMLVRSCTAEVRLQPAPHQIPRFEPATFALRQRPDLAMNLRPRGHSTAAHAGLTPGWLLRQLPVWCRRVGGEEGQGGRDVYAAQRVTSSTEQWQADGRTASIPHVNSTRRPGILFLTSWRARTAQYGIGVRAQALVAIMEKEPGPNARVLALAQHVPGLLSHPGSVR